MTKRHHSCPSCMAALIQECEEEQDVHVPPEENVVGQPVDSDSAFAKLEKKLEDSK